MASLLTNPFFVKAVNQARALRVAELLNDYRTLLVHIPQQHTDAPVEDYWEEGYIVMRECLSAAQNLISSNYEPIPAPSGGSGNEESEKAQLQRVMLDAGARRFQAHRIYLRMAAARRWVMNRAAVMRRMGGMEELKAVSRTFQEVCFFSLGSFVLGSFLFGRAFCPSFFVLIC